MIVFYVLIRYVENTNLKLFLDAQRPANKRRKRKGSNSGGPANNAPPVPSKKRSPGPNFSLASQVVVFYVQFEKRSFCGRICCLYV